MTTSIFPAHSSIPSIGQRASRPLGFRPLGTALAAWLLPWCAACSATDTGDVGPQPRPTVANRTPAVTPIQTQTPTLGGSITPSLPADNAGTGSEPVGSCSGDDECEGTSFCDGDFCRPKRASGSACARDAECASGLSCEGGYCSVCPLGQERICQTSDFCTCGDTCGDTIPDCGFGQTCARFEARPSEGVCVDDGWLSGRCGGCSDGEICSPEGQCEAVSRPSAAVLTATVTPTGAQNGTFTYDFSTEFVVFDAEGSSSDVSSVTVTDLPDDPLDSTDFGLAWDQPELECKVTQVTASSRTVSVPLVLDQSGSITDTDPGNLRIPAAKEFLASLSPSDESALFTFADNNPCTAFPVAVYGGGFTHDHDSFLGVIDSLAGCQGGGTPLYDAARGALELVVNDGVNDAKAMVVFTDGADTSSTATEQQVIDAAIAGGVKIFSIGLSQGVNHQVLSNLAQRTSGAYFFAADVGAAISAFRGMNQLLTGTYRRYACENGLTATVPDGKVPGTAVVYLGVTVDGERVPAPAFITF